MHEEGEWEEGEDEVPNDRDTATGAEEQVEEEIWAIFQRYAVESDLTYRQILGILEIVKANLIECIRSDEDEESQE